MNYRQLLWRIGLTRSLWRRLRRRVHCTLSVRGHAVLPTTIRNNGEVFACRCGRRF